ncbi:nuclear transport factor 2 family protein [Longispora albida]|uniref:nuclear transport factor 2 family protein n=1 Tax=Longispora albida TaxID=203523 RepID=UPI0003A62ADA|nr:nuclear transport factor 2 family protein [Longispora albida]
MDPRVTGWIDGYVRAWNSNRAEDIGVLFTEDARYFTAPYAEPWTGRADIVRQWLENADEPGDTEFSWDLLSLSHGLAVVQGHTVYKAERREYRNLWLIRLDAQGQCEEFTEWYMRVPG